MFRRRFYVWTVRRPTWDDPRTLERTSGWSRDNILFATLVGRMPCHWIEVVL